MAVPSNRTSRIEDLRFEPPGTRVFRLSILCHLVTILLFPCAASKLQHNTSTISLDISHHLNVSGHSYQNNNFSHHDSTASSIHLPATYDHPNSHRYIVSDDRNIKFFKAESLRNSDQTSTVLHDPYLSNSSSLYIKLLLVNDHSQYVKYDKNASKIIERNKQIVNAVNSYYRPLNVYIALTGVVIWTEHDEVDITTNGDSTLTNFLKYRFEKLLPYYKHDNAQLITSTPFNDSVVGKALKGTICTHEHSGGVTHSHSEDVALVAATVAHELGHNLNMEHDESNCTCPDTKCIMSASSGIVNPYMWSSCSREKLNQAHKQGLTQCLKHPPNDIVGPVCGNGFIEDGEDCDPGIEASSLRRKKDSTLNSIRCKSTDSCDLNNCCDRKTCKFVGNATCSDGACCDRNTCTVIKAHTRAICRQKQSECDFEEMCDGSSEFCPLDVYHHDGIECTATSYENDVDFSNTIIRDYNRTRAFCYRGQCRSHESQCRLLWGPTGHVSEDMCFDQNSHGNGSGHCGYDVFTKTYLPCESEHLLCGMLHCNHFQINEPGGPLSETGRLKYGLESAAIISRSFTVNQRQNSKIDIRCRSAVVDAGLGVPDPGLTPDGAFCAEEHMCLRQKCTPLIEIQSKDWCPSGCNGNGICNNRGVCHCNDGTIGTSCYRLFGSGFNFTVTLYFIAFFIPIIAIFFYAFGHFRKQIELWWYLRERMSTIKQRTARMANGTRAHPNQSISSIGQPRNEIDISGPLSLQANQQPYDPFVDPWANSDTKHCYRLEPLQSSVPARTAPPIPSVPPATQPNASNPSEQRSQPPVTSYPGLPPLQSHLKIVKK